MKWHLLLAGLRGTGLTSVGQACRWRLATLDTTVLSAKQHCRLVAAREPTYKHLVVKVAQTKPHLVAFLCSGWSHDDGEPGGY